MSQHDRDQIRRHIATALQPTVEAAFSQDRHWGFNEEKFEALLDFVELDLWRMIKRNGADRDTSNKLQLLFDGFSHARAAGRIDSKREAQRVLSLMKGLGDISGRAIAFLEGEEIDG